MFNGKCVFSLDFNGWSGINVAAETFQHLVEAYNVLASTSNSEAERVLGLVHTEQSIRNYEERIANVKDISHLTSADLDADF